MTSSTKQLLGIILGAIFIVIAYLYFTHSAQDLPNWLPGHQLGVTTKHIKHGIAASILAIGSFMYAWFQSGSKSQP